MGLKILLPGLQRLAQALQQLGLQTGGAEDAQVGQPPANGGQQLKGVLDVAGDEQAAVAVSAVALAGQQVSALEVRGDFGAGAQ